MKAYCTKKSEILYQETKNYLLDGVASSFQKAPDEDFPICMTHGKGSHLYDVDGNEYIDYVAGLCPMLLGYANQSVNQAVRNQLKKGTHFAATTPELVQLSKLLTEIIPCGEVVSFENSGTEANMFAWRVARGYTGKKKIIKFEGQYHGWADEQKISIDGSCMEDLGEMYSPNRLMTTMGQRQAAAEDMVVLPWNRIEILEDYLTEHKEEVAAVVMEPFMCDNGPIPPLPGYLEKVREITRACGVILIFDEVITGFRLALGGAQEYFGVTPDMAVFAKAATAGFPLAFIAGKREIMSCGVPASGTFNGNPLAVSAAMAGKDYHTSKQLFQEACEILPGGVNSPVRAFRSVGRNPVFIKKAYKDRVVDEDGNEWIDYLCSWGPGILGHANEKVVKEIQKAAESGLTFGAATAKEVELAKLIKQCMPSLEMVRMVSSGTEAVMSALRLARGYTRRDKIIKFAGCYHGHTDSMLVKAGSAGLTTGVPDSLGIPKALSEDTLVAIYNNEASVETLFEQYKGEIACVIVEPLAANMGVVPPKEGFLEFLREITKKNGTLLIFDEVITGFRLALGGASEYFGVKPNLTTLGKIVGGGMPVGAYGGRKEIMEMISPLGGVYQAGTLSGNPLAMTAGIATLKELMTHPGIYKELEEKAKILEASMNKMNAVQVNRCGSLLSVFFTEESVVDLESAKTADVQRFSDYFNYLFDRGIYVAPSQFEAVFLSKEHSAEDIRSTCEVLEEYAQQ